MEDTEERLDATAMATPPMQDATAVQAAGDTRLEVATNATDDVGDGSGNDLAALFARWVDNPLVAIALKDPRLHPRPRRQSQLRFLMPTRHWPTSRRSAHSGRVCRAARLTAVAATTLPASC